MLTAISVSRECKLTDKNVRVYVPRFVQGSALIQESTIVWESLENSDDTLDTRDLQVMILMYYALIITHNPSNYELFSIDET